MSASEITLSIGPIAGFSLGVGWVRRGRVTLGWTLVLISVGVVALAAIFGHARPIVGLAAWGLLNFAFIADEEQRRAVAWSCFSAGFIALIVMAFYT
jgi:hypothetical protein